MRRIRLVADSPQAADSEALLRDFQIQVSRYAALRRQLDAGPGPTMLTGPRGLRFLSAAALAEEVRRARRTASQGDIFSPNVAEHLRRTIHSVLRNEEMEHARRVAGE